MIVYDYEQRSDEWYKGRLGIPTASAADKILTPGKLMPSTQRVKYLNTLLAEWATGESVDGFEGTKWTDRGTELEPEARAYFEYTTGMETRQAGFVFRDESRLSGCSPDGLIGDDSGLEMKCPMPATHVSYLLAGKVPTGYLAQIQFSIWVCGARSWWFQSYCPGLPAVLYECQRDPKWMVALDEHIPKFIADLLAGRERLRELGVVK